jgi:FAD/FMN-containing dehydrogenase
MLFSFLLIPDTFRLQRPRIRRAHTLVQEKGQAVTDRTARLLNQLSRQLRGRLSIPGDKRFTAATAIWAKPVGRMPRAVVHCQTPQDVQLAIRAGRDSEMPISVRGGGHDWAGRALCEGIVIDLRALNTVAVCPDKSAARISGGARAADITARTDALGVAPVTGSVGAVGIAGLTLGGGYGPLIGRFGLAADNLIGATVVLADGRIVVATADDEPDLFWALRGGGGNFGVVVEMRHRLHHLPVVRSGLIIYPFADAKAVLDGFADIASFAPAELTTQVGLVAGSDGAPLVMLVPTWCGQPEQGEARLAPFFKLGRVQASTVDVRPYGASLKLFDSYLANGQRALMESCCLPALDKGSSQIFIEAMESAVSAGCAIFTHEFRGAAAQVPADATAFRHRRNHVLVEMLATFVDGPGNLDEHQHQQWLQAALHRFDATALPSGYPNLLPKGDVARAAMSYGDNAERLLKAKRRYDPDNIFWSAIPLPVDQSHRYKQQMERSNRIRKSIHPI